MKNILFTTLFIMALSAAAAQTYEIPLWPNGAAEDNGITEPERRDANNWNVYSISEAELYVWPAEGVNSGIAVLICPGGGYGMQAAGHEGKQYAEWLAANGITAAVLKYRLPNGHSEIPVTDARRAMTILRDMSADWGMEKIGVMGFSAGGHLASTLLTHYDKDSRPDFGILFYPVVTMTESTHGGSRKNLLGENPTPEKIEFYSNELQVTPDTPPTLVFFSEDDGTVPPKNGTMFVEALEKNGVEAKLVLYPTGGHGWGFGPKFTYHENMKAETLDWIGKFEDL